MDSYKLPRVASSILLLVAVSSLFSMFCLTQIDSIVNRDLYNYGLRFDFQWATPYWTITKTIFVLGWLNVTAAIAFQVYFLAYQRKKGKQIIVDGSSMGSIQTANRTSFKGSLKTNRRIAYLLLALGLVALLGSLFYTSSAVAFVGLGLTFWGALLLYITPTQRVEIELMNATVFPILQNTEQLVSTLKPNGKGVYLPPKYFKDSEASLIFIPSKAGQTLPKPDTQTNDVFLIPPGRALSKLFEKRFGRSIVKADFSYLKERLPRIVVEDLGIAENMDIIKEGNIITAEITDHIFSEICQETRKLQKTHALTGCPLCSAIACTLTKTTGSPVTIENEDQSRNERSTRVKFKLIED